MYCANAMAPVVLAFAVLDASGSATALGLVVGARSVANVALLRPAGSSPTGYGAPWSYGVPRWPRAGRRPRSR
ncbi:hypothetical protein ACFQ51_50340 [Streptomyces kaempferi]